MPFPGMIQTTMLTVDHVIVCVPDLDDSVRDFETEHGVATVPGGRHTGHGTANRLVPLGATYIELVAVVDATEAESSPFGTWVMSRARTPGADALAIQTDDLDAVCERLQLEPAPMSRPNAEGDELRWRVAALETMVNVGLPFFIQWDMDPSLHPGRIPVDHPAGTVFLNKVMLTGNPWQLQGWIGDVTGVATVAGNQKVDFELRSA